MRRSALLVGILGLLLGGPAPVLGQDRLWPVSVEVSFGAGLGNTDGEYLSNDRGLTADLLLGVPVASAGDGRIVTAGSIGIQGTGDIEAICLPSPEGECLPGFPQFTVASVLGGWETKSGVLRGLVGPGVVRAHGDWDTYRMAFLARIDAGMPVVGHLSLVGSLRGFLVPSYQDDSFRLVSFGLGLRLR